MADTNKQLNVTSDPLRVDNGINDGIHTVSIHMINFTGRVYIQATLADDPTEDDWFDIWLHAEAPYAEYPYNKPLDTTYVPTNYFANPGSNGCSHVISLLLSNARASRCG